MTELDKQLVRTSLRKMIRRRWFDICDFDTCAKIAGVLVPSETRTRLSSVHCVHFSDMPDEVRQFIHDSFDRFFGAHILEDPKPALEVIELPKKSKWKRLLGGE